MKTQSMQAMLERLSLAGEIETGSVYDLMPSDCRGDGYDIALTARTDESAEYTLPDGRIAVVACAVKVGSRNWHDGIPAGYRLEVFEPGTLKIVTEHPVSGAYVFVRSVTKANGGWKWVHGSRGYYRAVHVDADEGNASGLANAKGTIKIIAESNDVDFGTQARPRSELTRMISAAKRYAASKGLPLYINAWQARMMSEAA